MKIMAPFVEHLPDVRCHTGHLTWPTDPPPIHNSPAFTDKEAAPQGHSAGTRQTFTLLFSSKGTEKMGGLKGSKFCRKWQTGTRRQPPRCWRSLQRLCNPGLRAVDVAAAWESLSSKKKKKSLHCSLQSIKGDIYFSENLTWRSAKGKTVCCKGFNNEMLCAFGPDVWGKAKGPMAVSSPETVFNNWTVGLTVKTSPAKQPLDGEYKKTSPAGKSKEGKKNIKESTVIFTLGPILWSCSPSGKPNMVQALFYRKHLSNQDFFYWSHLFNRIAHHLKVNWNLFAINKLQKSLVNILWIEL